MKLDLTLSDTAVSQNEPAKALCGTFGEALRALGLLGTLATGSQVTENLHLRNLTYELPAGNILTCRQTLPMRRSVSHNTELKSIGAQINFGL